MMSSERSLTQMKKKELSITDFARLCGKARAKKMTKAERSESSRKAVLARWKKAKKGGKA